MNYKYNLRSLKPGDRLVLPKSDFCLVQHHAIYIGNDANGKRKYLENYIGKGVQLVSEQYLFRDGLHVTRIEPFKGSEIQRAAALKRAMQLIGTPYDLVNFNCEHYANTVQHNKSFSKQVGNGFVAALAFAFLGIGIFKQ